MAKVVLLRVLEPEVEDWRRVRAAKAGECLNGKDKSFLISLLGGLTVDPSLICSRVPVTERFLTRRHLV